jgi:hypothetical protein
MSKAKVLFYSLGAPILYLLLHFFVLFIVVTFQIASAASNGTLPTEMTELSQLIYELQSEYGVPSLLVSGVLFIFILWLRHRKASINLWTVIGITKEVNAKTLCFAALAGLAFHIACQGFFQAMPIPQSWHEANDAATQMFAEISFLTIITVGLFVPFVEEVAFRGFTQRILHHAFTPWQSVIIQGAVFAMFHSNMLQASYTFITGIFIGFIYMKSRNLWAAAAFHATFNSANYLMALLIGENGISNSAVIALMTAGGATLALLLVRNIEYRGPQKEEIE